MTLALLRSAPSAGLLALHALLAAAPAGEERSLLASPLHLERERPPVRAAEHLLLLHAGVPDVHPSVTRTHAEALAEAASIRARVERGEPFVELARRRSDAPSREHGAFLGTFVQGVLEPPLDEFLFAAEIGATSPPLETARGVHLLRRVEAHAGLRQILVAHGPDAQARCARVLERLAAGEDFAALARELSDDERSAARGGAYMVFERGPADRSIKQATFEMRVGEVRGPLESPLGLHLLNRVPHGELEPDLWEDPFARVSAILVAHAGALGAAADQARTPEAAEVLARELHAELAVGADLAELARRWNDDPGGRERAGDLGWIHRGTPGVPSWLARALAQPPGWLSAPIRTRAGIVLLRRDR